MADRGIPTIDDIKISEQRVKKLMENLSPYKARGPDGISPRVFRELAEELAPALTIIFQSYVTTIFKKGEQYNPANYRPISLTCIVCKLMEHIVVSSIMQHFETHCILNDNQHGFRRGRSCEIQLLEFVEELTTNLEGGRQTEIIVLDFATVFDRVNHSLHVHKLQCYGIRSSTITWIANFLSDRRQAVVVDRFLLLLCQSQIRSFLCQSQIRSTSGVRSWPLSLPGLH